MGAIHGRRPEEHGDGPSVQGDAGAFSRQSPDLARQEVVLTSEIWVVKVGTSVLTRDDGALDLPRIEHLAEQICSITATGRRVVLVSSGAVGAGVGRLGLPRRPECLPEIQAAAAVGQALLIRAYDEGFRRQGRCAAQILLTHEDFDDRTRYLNVRNTLDALLSWNAVPIINENDTISVDEIRFGDNDRLAAMVTNLLQAPLMIVLSVVDGLFAEDPSDRPADAPRLEPIRLIRELDAATMGLAGPGKSQLGSGGMASKLASARMVTQAGGSVIIASGRQPEPLTRILAGQEVGTLILPEGPREPARRRWIGLTARTRGILCVDHGAARALNGDGSSLLAIGITEVQGRFRKGDVVSVRDPRGVEIARGLCNYDDDDVRRIRGLRSDQVHQVLPQTPYDAVIHRNNLVMIPEGVDPDAETPEPS